MGRLLFFILVGVLVWLLWRGSLRLTSRPAGDEPRKSERGEDMVVCTRCGVHMPRSEARDEAGHLVCRDNPRCRPSP